jgi:hypothetical protein
MFLLRLSIFFLKCLFLLSRIFLLHICPIYQLSVIGSDFSFVCSLFDVAGFLYIVFPAKCLEVSILV